MNIEHVLTEAREILSTDGAWIQNEHCNGRGVDLRERLENSTSFCALGAIREVYRRAGLDGWTSDCNQAALVLQYALRDQGYGQYVDLWNDVHERQLIEVIDLFDKAIAYAGEKGI